MLLTRTYFVCSSRGVPNHERALPLFLVSECAAQFKRNSHPGQGNFVMRHTRVVRDSILYLCFRGLFHQVMRGRDAKLRAAAQPTIMHYIWRTIAYLICGPRNENRGQL